MNIPNLPTDNLYKFMALTGASMMILAFFFPFNALNTILNEVYLVESGIKELELEADFYAEDVQKLNNDIDQINKKIEEYDLPEENEIIDLDLLLENLKNEDYREYYKFLHEHEEDIIPLTKEYNKIMSKLDEIKNIKREINRNLNQLKIKNQFAKEKLHLLTINGLIFLFLLIYGLYLTHKGFKLWYIKLQKPMDKRIEKLANCKYR